MKNNIKFIDLFAGIGGFHQALSHFNTKCVFASEIDKPAVKTYEANYNIIPNGDITKINEADIPSHDAICGGFPCQPFSEAGHHKGFNDTRGTLFFDIVRIAEYHKPKLIFLENVPALVPHNNGKTLEVITETLDNIGYDVNYKILDAGHYGVPQHRERVFFVCFRKDLKVDNFVYPKRSDKTTSVIDILEDNPEGVSYIDMQRITLVRAYTPQINLFGELDLPNKMLYLGYWNGKAQSERVHSPYGHSTTLTCGCTGHYLINGQVRSLSPRECARLQGFPEHFKITSSKTNAIRQFGNSVCVNVVKAIFQEIYNTGIFNK